MGLLSLGSSLFLLADLQLQTMQIDEMQAKHNFVIDLHHVAAGDIFTTSRETGGRSKTFVCVSAISS